MVGATVPLEQSGKKKRVVCIMENDATLGMVPLKTNPIYTVYSAGNIGGQQSFNSLELSTMAEGV